MDPSNETWLSRLREDGPQQQGALVELRERLLRGLRRSLGNRPAADEAFLEDMAQEALLRILDRLPQFQGRSRFVTWATSIAIRIALSELRRRRWKDVSLDELTENASFALPHTDDGDARPAAPWERQAILDKMHEVIRTELTQKQRTALLGELKGMPQEAIARHLGSNRNAVYKLTHDARKKLKRGLEDAGYAADDVHAAFAT